jgi:hypothetical protein
MTVPSRRELRVRRRADYWAARVDAAHTPAERARVAFHWLQARAKTLPDTQRDALWRALTQHLDGLAPGTSHANFASPGSENTGPTRTDGAYASPGVRGRARVTHLKEQR